MSEKPVKAGAPPCGLYYRLPEGFVIDDARRRVREIAFVVNRSSGYEKNMDIVEIPGSAPAQSIAELVSAVRAEGFISLIAGNVAAAKESDADGVILADLSGYTAARETLGADAIIGMAAGASKDLAQKAFDAGIDTVSFGIRDYGLPDANLLKWWKSLGPQPSVALGDITDDTCGLLAQAGAGFVDVTAFIDNHPGGVMQAVVDALHALEMAAG